MKKFLLVAINSKYIHSNLAVRCLKKAATPHENLVSVVEYSINNRTEDILKGIYHEKPDVVGFSCYIWNIEFVKEIVGELNKLMPQLPIWLGGPEVSYNPTDYIGKYPIAGIMCGEGELVFNRLVAAYAQNTLEEIKKIPGISMNSEKGIIVNPCPQPIELNNPLPYDEEELNSKIIYYESQRGCPFSCSYCLSSVDKRMRFRDLNLVKKDVQTFINHNVKLVKFIDRTFNAKKEHAYEILRFIKENDNGITCFHFEISADILDEEGLEIFNSLRPGLVQLEIGVQSTNQDTIKAINRSMDLKKLAHNVERLKKAGNIHIHLDLIAGLPYEDLESFKKSFNDIYVMQPEHLQLGFLKLLYGSNMRADASKYGIITCNKPPYEVLSTNFLSYEDILTLKTVENVVEMFYNSGMFTVSIKFLERYAKNPFELFMELGKLFDKRYPMGSLPDKNGKYRLLYDYAKSFLSENELGIFAELLKFDMLLRDNLKSPPEFVKMDNTLNIIASRALRDKKLTKAEHVEVFLVDVLGYLEKGELVQGKFPVYFNYLNRDALNGNAEIKQIEMENNNEKNSSNN